MSKISRKNSGFQPRISVSQFDDITISLNDKCGKWTYGDYYRGFSKKINQETMVKLIDLSKFPLKKKVLDTEISILTQLKACHYIVHFMQYKYYEKTLAIVHESYNGGNLKDYLAKNGPLSEATAVRLLMQLISGLKALYDLGYIHGAVRPENILLYEDEYGVLTCKLSNFVFARKVEGDKKATSPWPYDNNYSAPELIKNSEYHESSDIWSLGCIYYQMLHGKLPFEGKNPVQLKDSIMNTTLKMSATEEITDTSVDFINKCLQKDTKFRIQWKDIGDHRLLFRALFQKEDGTFRLYNPEFAEFTPSKRHVMFGMRQSSLPGSPKRRNSLNADQVFSHTPRGSRFKQNDLNMSGMSSFSQFALNATGNNDGSKSRRNSTPDLPDFFVPKVNPSTFSNQKTEPNSANIHPPRSISPIQHKNETKDISAMTDHKEKTKTEGSLKEVDVEVEKSIDQQHTSPESRVIKEAGSKSNVSSPSKKEVGDFASNLLSKVASTDEFFLAKYLNKEDIDNSGPFSKKSFVKPFKWLANKAEIVSEIYELATKNKNHCCYDKIVQTLNEENAEWKTINLVNIMQKQFSESIDSANKKEENKSMAWPKNLKTNNSMTKKEKSNKIYSLIEEIVASLTNHAENGKANNEHMIQIAANLKILREFDEIGDNLMKELESMKNSLIIFYRKRDVSHIKYLLLVRNLV